MISINLPDSQAEILIVDDTPANLRLLLNLLKENGYKVRPVTSGNLALEAARTSPPDLTLLDILMPELDGYTVCQQLKADPEKCTTPSSNQRTQTGRIGNSSLASRYPSYQSC